MSTYLNDKHGERIYQEIKRMKIQDRLDSMLEFIVGVSQKKVDKINKNFKIRKTGGLLSNEITELNKIWETYEINRIGVLK